MRSITLEETNLTEIDLPNARSSFRNFFGSAGVLADGPQAYLVNLPDAGSFVPPHFHDIDQYQVALFGQGLFGKKHWGPGVFVYSDAYGPYGPIRAGEGGVSFLTLRVAASSGQFEMPGSRHLMPGAPGRTAYGRFDVSAPLPTEGSPAATQVLSQRADGMMGMGMRIAPHGRERGMSSDGGGQYYVVCAGSLQDAGKTLPVGALIFVERDEDPPVLQAGPDGAVVIMVQFPRPTDRPGSDPEKLRQRDYSVEYVIAS